MAPLEAPISASAEQREMWHTLLLLFSREQRTLFLDLIQVTVDEVYKLLKKRRRLTRLKNFPISFLLIWLA